MLQKLFKKQMWTIKNNTLYVLKESKMKIAFHLQRLSNDDAGPSSGWYQCKDRSQTWDAHQSLQMSSSEEPQRDEEERRWGVQDQDEDESWAIKSFVLYIVS